MKKGIMVTLLLLVFSLVAVSGGIVTQAKTLESGKHTCNKYGPYRMDFAGIVPYGGQIGYVYNCWTKSCNGYEIRDR